MAFKQLNKDLLIEVATYFGVSLPKEPSKNIVLAALSAAEPPVTWEMYTEAFPETGPQTTTEKAKKEGAAAKFASNDEPVLIKMQRGNPRYEVRGYKFTLEHPFLLVDRADADYILNNLFGFRVATTDEVTKYYS